MRTLVATFLAAVSLLAAAAPAAAGRGGVPVPPFPKLAGNWSHAEINVTIKHEPHTLILDRGRVTQVSPLQITLRARDRTTAVIPLSAQTLVQLGNRPATLLDLHKGENVMTMRIDGGAAVRVRILAL